MQALLPEGLHLLSPCTKTVVPHICPCCLQNIMKCTPDEILALALQKLHPSLDVAFQEAGMPVEPSSASSGNNLTVTGSDLLLLFAQHHG
jgi:hypothetical protein